MSIPSPQVVESALAAYIACNGVDALLQMAPGGAPTAQAAADALGVPLSCVVKTMILTNGRFFVAAVIPGDRKLDRRKLSAAINVGFLRFASAIEVLEQTGYPAGGVAPIGLRKRMRVVVEADLMKTPSKPLIGGGGCEDLLLRISASEIILFSDASVAPISKDPDYGL